MKSLSPTSQFAPLPAHNLYSMSVQTISHYHVLGELGRGGMGVVYKAEDTKLNRTVALKVLPPHALASQDDRARFYREARAAAALHHPHIATVFEIDEHDGQPFIAMEYIDGQCLDDRIAEGLLPLKEVVSIATQVADALKAAHDKDIVHRDVKSGNVMLTSSGVAKVLDFGLAKTAASTKLTQMGSTLGTVAYMSPEQARGEDVDRRADLWSLGAVMYEMISGKLPFPGDFEQAVIYSILNEEPKPLTSIRTGVPMGLEWIVSKLLAKNPDERYQNARDLLVDLRTVDLDTVGMSRVSAQSRIAATTANAAAAAGSAERTLTSGPLGTGGILRPALAFIAGLILMTGIWYLMPASEDAFVETSVKRFEISVPTTGSLGGVDISPDGSKIVYADADNTVDNVYILDLSTGTTRKVEGSAGTVLVSVSPDGEWILLTKGLSVDRVSIVGGSPLEVAVSQEGTPRAGWGHGDWVVFENQQTVWKASTTTRESVPLTIKDTLAGEVDHDWPQLLPDGRTIVATIEYRNGPSAIGFWDMETGERKGQISLPGYRVTYTSNGYLMFVLSSTVGNLLALPFDLATLTVTGSPIPVKTNVSTLIAAVSYGGTLVTGGPQGSESLISSATRLAVTTFPGIVSPLGFEPAIYRSFELSPDGKKLTAAINDVLVSTSGVFVGTGEDVWVLDLE
ncbi:MAG: protein kinase, partial [Rhodothermia bacterium]